MRSDGLRNHKALRSLVVLVLAHTLLLGPAFAKKEPKTYPQEGKITGLGTNKREFGRGSYAFSHTYKVQTDTKIFELDCGKMPFLGHTGGECGGEKKLQIGDVLHFRVEKGWAYIPVTGKGEDGKPRDFEQKLRILSEDLKPDAKPEETKP